jgi:hypothetical protein
VGDPLDLPEPGAPRGPLLGRPRKPATLVRGILAERVAITVPLDPYLSLRALAGYSGLSVRRLRDLLSDPAHPLPCYRIGVKILVRRSEYDGWAARFRRLGSPDVERIAAAIRDVRSGPRRARPRAADARTAPTLREIA